MDNESAVGCGYEVARSRAYEEVTAGCGPFAAMLEDVGRVSRGLEARALGSVGTVRGG